ncbi:KN motif and ankyrin repeat domain-containing protein 1 [Taenia crassiceps]|uniref:KN motif and ankyrin repeat domain-containing protein 1 n=1 Tax=Taenia crassiceps TaxID=6207 RepID=A0ABR4Q9A5_9CEST
MDSDSASLISSEFEIEVVTPLKQLNADGVHQSFMEGEFSRVTENSKKTTLPDPISKDLPSCEWVSNQRNNNKKVEIGGWVIRPSQFDVKGAFNYDLTDFINACHLLQQSLENPKSVSPSKMMDAIPILHDYWFYNTASSGVTVESFKALLSAVSHFPPSIVGRVVNQRDKKGCTFLHVAVRKRLWQLIETALEECREFDLNQTDACGRTPLILMTFYASQPMGMEEHAALDSLVRWSTESTRTAALLAAVGATERGDCGGATAVVARLCARGTRLERDRRDALGNTALMLAVRYNNLAITRLLLLLRPDLCSLQARNQEGRSVMDLAKMHHVSPEILRLLQAKAVSVQKNLLPSRARRRH